MKKVINKSRQGIPVSVVQDGKTLTVHLRASGELSTTTTTEITTQLQNLVDKGLVVLREVEAGAEAKAEPRQATKKTK